MLQPSLTNTIAELSPERDGHSNGSYDETCSSQKNESYRCTSHHFTFFTFTSLELSQTSWNRARHHPHYTTPPLNSWAHSISLHVIFMCGENCLDLFSSCGNYCAEFVVSTMFILISFLFLFSTAWKWWGCHHAPDLTFSFKSPWRLWHHLQNGNVSRPVTHSPNLLKHYK
jgi:hypothetical protein